MATQLPGRKRIPNREKLSAEDDMLCQIAREAEARLAAKRAARAEAREFRMKELERQQKEEDSERYSRHSRRHTSMSDEEERMSVGSRGSLRAHHTDLCGSSGSLSTARLQNGRNTDYNGFLGSSSRASSRASSARASPVVEERSDFLEKVSRTASTLSSATLASLGGGFSRRGSCETSISAETETSMREIKDSLFELEEKYRKAMVSNAQLDNEKTNLLYQVDTLRDTIMELEEHLCETHRACQEKSRDYERERHSHSVLKLQFEEIKEKLKQTEEQLNEYKQFRGKQDDYIREISDLNETLEWKEKKIQALERQKEYSHITQDERDSLRDEVCRLRGALKKHGIVATNGEDVETVGKNYMEIDSLHIQDPHTSTLSENDILEFRLRRLMEERQSLLGQIQKLKAAAENNGIEETNTDDDDFQNGVDSHVLDLQRDASRQISDMKFKLVKSEQEVTALEQNIIRLEGQVTRYKSAAEAAEKMEDELKVEKRKMQRELRSALDRIDELEASNNHLTKRLEKMKANRSALLAQQ